MSQKKENKWTVQFSLKISIARNEDLRVEEKAGKGEVNATSLILQVLHYNILVASICLLQF